MLEAACEGWPKLIRVCVLLVFVAAMLAAISTVIGKVHL
jgi:hypothetical protein